MAYEEERQVLAGLGDIVVAQPQGEDEIPAAVRGADAVIINLYPLGAAAIAQLHGCRVISRYGIGFDNIDVPAATAAGIWVSTVPDYGWEDVSDHALALFLACVRKLTFADAAVRGGRWGVPRNRKSYRIRGKVFGLVGYGGIGRPCSASSGASAWIVSWWPIPTSPTPRSRRRAAYRRISTPFCARPTSYRCTCR